MDREHGQLMLLPTQMVILASRVWQHHQSDELFCATSSLVMLLYMLHLTCTSDGHTRLLNANVARATGVLMTPCAPRACPTSHDFHLTVLSRSIALCARGVESE